MLGLFSIIHGAGNGILTIARGTLPLVLFGPHGYGARLGRISLPGRVGAAIGPFLFGAAVEHFGARTLFISSALSLAALLSLFQLSVPEGRIQMARTARSNHEIPLPRTQIQL